MLSVLETVIISRQVKCYALYTFGRKNRYLPHAMIAETLQVVHYLTATKSYTKTQSFLQ